MNDLLLNVNKQTFYCNQKIASESSPLIRKYLEASNTDYENQGSTLRKIDITIPDISDDEDLSILNEIINNRKIEIAKDNYSVSLKIGRHFLMENIIEQCKLFHKFEMLINFFNNDEKFQIQLKLEKIFIEMNEMNINNIFDQCIAILPRMPFDCFYNFIIHIFLYSNEYLQKLHLLIQLLEKIEGSINGIIPSFLKFIFNIIGLKVTSPKKSNYIARISLFIYELCTKMDNSFLKEDIFINSSNFCIPALLRDILFYDKSKQTIRINTDNNISKKSNLGNSFSYIRKEINAVIHDNSDISENSENNDDNEINDNSQISILLESIQRDDFDSLQNISQELEKKNSSQRNQSNYGSLLEYSAFFGSMKSFQYLLNNRHKFDINRLSLYAIAGGNTDIIHFCERNDCVFGQESLKISIRYHQHFLSKWLVETKHIEINQHILKESIKSYNINIFNYFINRKVMIDGILLHTISANNFMLFNSLLELEKKNIGFPMYYDDGCATALHIACDRNNAEIVKILLMKENIDINAIYEVQYF